MGKAALAVGAVAAAYHLCVGQLDQAAGGGSVVTEAQAAAITSKVPRSPGCPIVLGLPI